MTSNLAHDFAAAMAGLGPFEAAPRLAAGVSGGADSMALALLAAEWAAAQGGTLLALIVDHGLRSGSADEARLTASRLAPIGIPARILTVSDLGRGPALAARARDARYRALTQACATSGVLHLLIGHHAADQAETLMIRALGGSGGRGLAGMPGLVETPTLRVLRPLLTISPVRLRAFLEQTGVEWVEDPSNTDRRALRPRLRLLRADPGGDSEGTQALIAASRTAGRARSSRDGAIAAALAQRVTIHPEGFALLTRVAIAPDALGELLRVVGGSTFAPSTDQVADIAAHPRPCTLAGVRLTPAGRLGEGLLIVREAASVSPDIEAAPGATWDGRFRLATQDHFPPGTTIGALGADASRFRRGSDLPATVLRVLPALRRGNILVAVPHLLYPDPATCARVKLVFSSSRPLAGAPFVPA